MATVLSPEEKELRLISNVEFKILQVANDDAKLQALLHTYMAPLLLKLNSEHARVKTKVIDVYQRLHGFIKPRNVVLPVEALIDQYKATSSDALRSLDAMGIQHSAPRLEPHERARLFPKLVRGIASDTSPSCRDLFSVILATLFDITIPPWGSPEDVKLRDTLGLSDPEDAAFVAEWLGKVLRLKLVEGASESSPRLSLANDSLSQSDLEFLLVEASRGTFARMATLSTIISKLISSAAFRDDEKLIPAICAAVSRDTQVASAGDALLRRSEIDLEDERVVRQLYEAHEVLGMTYRIKILSLLQRSTRAMQPDMDEHILGVVDLNFPDDPDHPLLLILQQRTIRERTRLQRSSLGLLSALARTMRSGQRPISDVANRIIDTMHDLFIRQGWPVPLQSRPHEEVELRAEAYGIIGGLHAATVTDPSRLKAFFLFESLSKDPTPGVVVQLNAALSSVAAAVAAKGLDVTEEVPETLAKFLLRSDDEPLVVRSVRHAVVAWANAIFPFSFTPARWIDILAVAGRPGDTKDVADAGLQGLDPWFHSANAPTPPALPSWVDMWQQFTHTGPGSLRAHLGVDVWYGPRPPVLVTAMYVANMLLLTSLGSSFTIGPNWEAELSLRLQSNLKAQNKTRSYLDDSTFGSHVTSLLRMCIQGTDGDSPSQTEDFLDCFVRVGRFAPVDAIAPIAELAAKLLRPIKSTNPKIQSLAAQAFGILAAHPAVAPQTSSSAYGELKEMAAHAEGAGRKEHSALGGSFLAMAHMASRLVYYGISVSGDFLEQQMLDQLTNPRHPDLKHAATVALGEMWAAGRGVSDNALVDGRIVETLSNDAKAGSELAVRTLGRFAVQAPDGEEEAVVMEDALTSGRVGSVLQALFGLHELRQFEMQFAVGEAIAAAIARWDSVALQLTLDVGACTNRTTARKRSIRIRAVMDKLFDNCRQTKPSLLKASGVWLLCMVQYCSHLDEVKSRMRESQAAFMRLLGARDELVQETAARGLTLQYERGDAGLRAELTRDLVSAFTGTGAGAGSGSQLKVGDETELFEPGMLAAGDGQSATSYRDIVSMAQEAGDPSLVYKLMSLSSNAAMWSTRSALARFGLGNILSESEIDPKIYPKLYRYRFDPNPKVQRSMETIWAALVPKGSDVLDRHFDAIMEELLGSMVGREWRTREASCGAMVALVLGAQFAKYDKYYARIWRTGFRALDDIKDSVRVAAWKMCRAMSGKLSTELREFGETKRVAAMLREVMPFLLGDNGVDSGIREAKVFALATLLSIIKDARALLKPYLVELVPKLLGLLSTVEPEVVNYGYQRADDGQRQALDQLRSDAVRTSPFMDAIDTCFGQMDADAGAVLVPKLLDTIKSALGEPTKLGCGHALSMLYTRHVASGRPFADRFLDLVGREVLRGTDEVRKGYSVAAAHIMRAAGTEAQVLYLDRLQEAYFSDADDESRSKASDGMVALFKVSPDNFAHNESRTTSLVYFGSHDVDEYTRKGFHTILAGSAGVRGRMVALHVDEICQLAQRGLGASRWGIKHSAALTAAAMVTDMSRLLDSSNGQQFTPAQAKAVWAVLEPSLNLKVFDGKKDVIAALPVFVDKARGFWGGDEAVGSRIEAVFMREAKRRNEAYRPHALTALREFARVRPDLNLFPTILGVAKPELDRFAQEHNSRQGHEPPAEDFALAQAAFEAIVQGWSATSLEQDHIGTIKALLGAVSNYLANPAFGPLKRTWYEAVDQLLVQAEKHKSPQNRLALAIELLDTLGLASAPSGLENERLARARALRALGRALGKGAFGEMEKEEGKVLEARVPGSLVQAERSADVVAVLEEALGILRG